MLFYVLCPYSWIACFGRLGGGQLNVIEAYSKWKQMLEKLCWAQVISAQTEIEILFLRTLEKATKLLLILKNYRNKRNCICLMEKNHASSVYLKKKENNKSNLSMNIIRFYGPIKVSNTDLHILIVNFCLTLKFNKKNDG